MGDLPFIFPVVNLSLVAGVVVFILRVVAKGTWMHKTTHDEIVTEWREKYGEVRTDRDYWRNAALAVSGVTDRLAAVTEQAVKTNGNGG